MGIQDFVSSLMSSSIFLWVKLLQLFKTLTSDSIAVLECHVWFLEANQKWFSEDSGDHSVEWVTRFAQHRTGLRILLMRELQLQEWLQFGAKKKSNGRCVEPGHNLPFVNTWPPLVGSWPTVWEILGQSIDTSEHNGLSITSSSQFSLLPFPIQTAGRVAMEPSGQVPLPICYQRCLPQLALWNRLWN